MTDSKSIPETLTAAISQVAAEIGGIEKNGQFFGRSNRDRPLYRYLKHEDILAALMPQLQKNGLTIVPHAIGAITRTTTETMTYVHTIVTYRISHVTGTYQDAVVMAEAADHGDKASAKLMTAAHKALVKQVFGITDSEAAADIEDDDLPVAKAQQEAKIHKKYIDPVTEYGIQIMSGDEKAVDAYRDWFVKNRPQVLNNRTMVTYTPFWSDRETVGTPLTYMSALANLLKRWRKKGGDLAEFAEKNKSAAPWA